MMFSLVGVDKNSTKFKIFVKIKTFQTIFHLTCLMWTTLGQGGCKHGHTCCYESPLAISWLRFYEIHALRIWFLGSVCFKFKFLLVSCNLILWFGVFIRFCNFGCNGLLNNVLFTLRSGWQFRYVFEYQFFQNFR